MGESNGLTVRVRYCKRCRIGCQYMRHMCRPCYRAWQVAWSSDLSTPLPDRNNLGPNPVRPASAPTSIPPGPHKVPVLEARAAAGEQLFHKDDAPISLE